MKLIPLPPLPQRPVTSTKYAHSTLVYSTPHYDILLPYPLYRLSTLPCLTLLYSTLLYKHLANLCPFSLYWKRVLATQLFSTIYNVYNWSNALYSTWLDSSLPPLNRLDPAPMFYSAHSYTSFLTSPLINSTVLLHSFTLTNSGGFEVLPADSISFWETFVFINSFRVMSENN